eukprot:m.154824 g.154824  ORF g.154824 m.154824 type:complete len:844 (+) comp14386_c0_seq2:86-2617(+)
MPRLEWTVDPGKRTCTKLLYLTHHVTVYKVTVQMLSKFGDEDVSEEEQLESLQTIAKSPKLTAELQALIYAHVNDMGNDMEVCYRHDSMALYAERIPYPASQILVVSKREGEQYVDKDLWPEHLVLSIRLFHPFTAREKETVVAYDSEGVYSDEEVEATEDEAEVVSEGSDSDSLDIPATEAPPRNAKPEALPAPAHSEGTLSKRQSSVFDFEASNDEDSASNTPSRSRRSGGRSRRVIESESEGEGKSAPTVSSRSARAARRQQAQSVPPDTTDDEMAAHKPRRAPHRAARKPRALKLEPDVEKQAVTATETNTAAADAQSAAKGAPTKLSKKASSEVTEAQPSKAAPATATPGKKVAAAVASQERKGASRKAANPSKKPSAEAATTAAKSSKPAPTAAVPAAKKKDQPESTAAAAGAATKPQRSSKRKHLSDSPEPDQESDSSQTRASNSGRTEERKRAPAVVDLPPVTPLTQEEREAAQIRKAGKQPQRSRAMAAPAKTTAKAAPDKTAPAKAAPAKAGRSVAKPAKESPLNRFIPDDEVSFEIPTFEQPTFEELRREARLRPPKEQMAHLLSPPSPPPPRQDAGADGGKKQKPARKSAKTASGQDTEGAGPARGDGASAAVSTGGAATAPSAKRRAPRPENDQRKKAKVDTPRSDDAENNGSDRDGDRADVLSPLHTRSGRVRASAAPSAPANAAGPATELDSPTDAGTASGAASKGTSKSNGQTQVRKKGQAKGAAAGKAAAPKATSKRRGRSQPPSATDTDGSVASVNRAGRRSARPRRPEKSASGSETEENSRKPRGNKSSGVKKKEGEQDDTIFNSFLRRLSGGFGGFNSFFGGS